MLQKPGSSSSGSTPRTTRGSSKQIVESPDDVIRKLSRLPPNKKCCDCTSKLPSSVNVTLGVFLCPPCAGIHRELPGNPRIKSIGHTTFTKEEVDMIASTGGNERMNAMYLANYHPSQERMKPPVDNSDVRMLRTWILRKYKEKTWYRHENSTTRHANTTTGSSKVSDGPSSSSSTSNTSMKSTNSKTERGIAGMMRQPTVVANIPPKPNPKADAMMVDLFGDSGPTSTAASTATTDSEWDAFSSSRIQQQQQVAAVDDFANFDAAVASPATTSSAPPTTTTTTTTTNMVQSTPFANFDNLQTPVQQQQQQQQPSNSNFASFPVTTTTVTAGSNFMAQPPTPPIQSHGGNDFGNFSSFDTTTNNNNNNNMNHNNNISNNNNGFANFESIASMHAPTMSSVSHPTNSSIPQPQPQQFPMVSQPQPLVPPQQQQQPHQPPGSFDKFDAFDSLQISSTTATTNDGSLNMGNMNQINTTTNMSIAANSMTVAPLATNVAKATKFQSGQKVYYKSSSYSGPAKIIKVHFDDALEPFYTIALTDENDKEKQTDDAHLLEHTDHTNQSVLTNDTTALQGEITSLLTNLSKEQLHQIKQFIVQNIVTQTLSFPSIATKQVSTTDQNIPPGNSTPLEMTATNVVPQQQQIPPAPPSMAPGQMSHVSMSSPTMQQPPQIPQPYEVQSLPHGEQFHSNNPMPQQEPTFASGTQTTATIPHQASMMAPNGVISTGTMMGNVGSTMINGATSSNDFGGIPSPDMGGESKPSVATLSSLPAPPLVPSQQILQPYPSSMMNPTQPQGFMPQQSSSSSSMMMMTQTPQYQPGLSAQHHVQPPGQSMMTNFQMQASGQQAPQLPQMNVPQQQPPMNPSQNTPVSNDQAPLSPLSPKGNPFDFY